MLLLAVLIWHRRSYPPISIAPGLMVHAHWMMELLQLRSFLAVSEDLHYGHAAVRFNVAQPSVTRTIQVLECELRTAFRS